MKILIITNVIPYPLNEGGKTAQFFFLQNLIKEHDVAIILKPVTDAQQKDVENLKISLPGLRVHSLRNTNRHVKKNVFTKIAGIIIWELTKRLPKEISENDVSKNELFINPVRARNTDEIKQIASILNNEKPDIVQVDFIDNADIALMLPDNQKKVIIAHDLRFSSVEQSATINHYDKSYVNYLTGFVKTAELAYLKNFDGVITFSNEDSQKYFDAGLQNVFVSPFAVDDKKFTQIDRAYQIKKLVFIGPGYHVPNLDALQWYAENLSASIKEKYGLDIWVIGEWNATIIKKMEKYPAVKFLGFVEDISAVLQDSAMIVPLRIGSGIRTKVLEAFAMGIPVISTGIGIEGIGAVDGKEYLLADDVKSFENAIEELLLNNDKTFQLRMNAQKLVCSEFSQEVVCKKRIAVYNKIMNA